MFSFLLSFLASILLTVLPALSEDSIDFEDRWITRPSQDEEYPHSVVVKMSAADDGICSGALLTYGWILTAARCMYRGQKKVVETNTSLTIYAGVDDDVNGPHVQKRISKMLLIHDIPGKDSYFSLALVNVDPPFKGEYKGKTVKPLDTLDYVSLRNKDKESTCKSGTYGRIEWNQDKPLELKKILTAIKDCNCTLALKEAFPHSSPEQWLCGEFEYNIGVCKGDFGGTLQCNNVVAVPINIVTFSDRKNCVITDKVSKKCSDSLTVSIYVDVCYHLSWIHKFVPSVPLNKTACDAPASAISVLHSGYCILYFVFFLFLIRYFF